MASYIVLSFDVDSSSSIRIHALTCDRDRATEIYEAVLALRGGDELVEMLRLSDDFKCVDGADVFWGNHASGHGAPEKGAYCVIRSNNRPCVTVAEGQSLHDASRVPSA